MKLDSIIYDSDTLSAALQQKLIEESPSFQQLYPSETSTALTNLLGGYGAMLQYTIVSALANCYMDTAFTPSAIYQLSETLGNRLHGNVSARLLCDITRTNLSGVAGVTIPKNSVFEVEGVPFFNENAIFFPLGIDTIPDVSLVQGEYTIVEGTTSGVAGEKFYFSNNFLCNMEMVKVFINGEEWSTTESFLPLNSENLLDETEGKTVILRMDSSGRAFIKFGNNSNGVLPIAGSTIRIEYVSNIGSKGNIEKADMSIKLIDSIYYTNNAVDTLLTINATTNSPSYGGYDQQSLEILKESSPFVFASGNRAVRRNDYKALLLNKCGYISTNVWGEYEEAQANGGYDKIMMNMVYYTGIKEIQQYDYKPQGGLDIIDSIEGVCADNPIFFTSTIGSIKGFPGSYSIDLIYSLNDAYRIKYTDKNGNGILVCDPSENNYNYDLYPYNDGLLMYGDPNKYNMSIRTMQPCVDDTWEGNIRKQTITIDNLMTDSDGELVSSGCYDNGSDMKMSFDNPFQIEIMFDEKRALSMFAFKTPGNIEDIAYFPGKIAIYATDETDTTDPTFTINIKNNSLWDKIAEVQQVNVVEEANTWSDWITTKLFDPSDSELMIGANKGWRKYKRYMIEIYYLHDLEKTDWRAPVKIKQMKFMTDYVTSPRYAWGGQEKDEDGEITTTPIYFTLSSTPSAGDVVYDADMQKILKTDKTLKYQVSSYGISDGKKYLVIQDNEKSPSDPDYHFGDITTTKENLDRSFINENDNKEYIDHKTSTVNYEYNSIVELCVPALLNDIYYYEYSYEVSGLTAANGYKTGDLLTYAFDNGMYANVKVTNINTNSYQVSINNIRGQITNINTKQPGMRQINCEGVDLEYISGSNAGSGAKITVYSNDAMGVYASFTGNAYNTATAQSVDSPVLEKYNHFTTYTEFKQPRVKAAKINVTVEYNNISTYKEVKQKVKEAINSIFTITPYYIGKSLDVSDIWAAINNVAGVRRFIVNYPTENIECQPYEFITLPESNLTLIDKFSEDFK